MTDREKLEKVAAYARQQVAEIRIDLQIADKSTGADLRCELMQWRSILKMIGAAE